MPYDCKILPDGFKWVGAVAGPDGYRGDAYVANVAKDGDGCLWVFVNAGRFSIDAESFERRKISDVFLPVLPILLSPYDKN